MFQYVVRRLLLAIPMLLIASCIMFVMVSLSGDPLARYRSTDPPPSPESLQLMADRLNLDEPLPLRYWNWVRSAATLDFGQSLAGVDVSGLIAERLEVTLRLVAGSMVLAAVLAFVIGGLGALFHDRLADRALTLLSFVCLALPVFWVGVILKYAAIGVNQRLGTTFFYTIGDGVSSGVSGLALIGYFAMPMIVLVINNFASWSRYVRASLIDVMSADYIKLARAKGMTRHQAFLRHGVRNGMLPFVTILALDFSAIVGGAVVTESIFQWRGMGDLLVTGINTLDTNIVMAWLIVFAAITIVFNLMADVLYGVLDPRVRVGRGRA